MAHLKQARPKPGTYIIYKAWHAKRCARVPEEFSRSGAERLISIFTRQFTVQIPGFSTSSYGEHGVIQSVGIGFEVSQVPCLHPTQCLDTSCNVSPGCQVIGPGYCSRREA